MSGIERNANGKASVVAEEVISVIRTVLAFNGQEKEIKRWIARISFWIDEEIVCYVDTKNIWKMLKNVRLEKV